MNEGYPQLFGNPENPNLVARVRGQLVALAEPAFLTVFSEGRTFPGVGAAGALRGEPARVRKDGPRLTLKLHRRR
jgi:hypothetical protein